MNVFIQELQKFKTKVTHFNQNSSCSTFMCKRSFDNFENTLPVYLLLIKLTYFQPFG